MTGMHALEAVEVEGHSGLVLRSPAGLSARFVPSAGMVCDSLTLDGTELLARGDGLAGYVGRGALCGIPLLHPWANRLSGDGCGFRFPTCSVRLSCNWAFFAKWVPHYHFNFANWCESGSGILDEDTHATHGPRLCDTALALSTRCVKPLARGCTASRPSPPLTRKTRRPLLLCLTAPASPHSGTLT